MENGEGVRRSEPLQLGLDAEPTATQPAGGMTARQSVHPILVTGGTPVPLPA